MTPVRVQVDVEASKVREMQRLREAAETRAAAAERGLDTSAAERRGGVCGAAAQRFGVVNRAVLVLPALQFPRWCVWVWPCVFHLQASGILAALRLEQKDTSGLSEYRKDRAIT